MYAVRNFMEIVTAFLEIYMSCVHGQTDRPTDNPIFYKVETYLDRLLLQERKIIPNFVKIFRAVLDTYERCVHTQTDRKPDFLQV